MLSLENSSSPFLQDSGPCQTLTSFSDDFLYDGGAEPDLSLAVEMIEAEERNSCDTKSTSPMHTNNVDLSDLVDIISQSYKKFPLSHDLPNITDTLLGSDDLLNDTNDFLSDIGSDDLMSDSYSGPESPELINIIPVVTEIRQEIRQEIRHEIKKIPEEERPSKKYPHILSTLQGTYKGLSPMNVPSPVTPRYTTVIPSTHTLGVIPSVTQNVTRVAHPVRRPVTLHQNIPRAHAIPVTVQSNHVKVTVPISQSQQSLTPQATRVVTVSQPVTRICSPVSVQQTITPHHVPQATVPTLPPPITEPKKYIVVPQGTNGHVAHGRTVQLAHPVSHSVAHPSSASHSPTNTVLVSKPSRASGPPPPYVDQRQTMSTVNAVPAYYSPVQSPAGSDTTVSMDEDECLSIPKTVCSKMNSEPMLPVVVKLEEDAKSFHSVSIQSILHYVKILLVLKTIEIARKLLDGG